MEDNGKQELDTEAQVQVRFTTKLQGEFRVANTPFAVPASLTRYGLSEVINSLLNLDKHVPFDFLLEGELIRTSLRKLLLAKHVSAETIISIEYLPTVLPPVPKETYLHDDWVSAVDGSMDRFIFSGSYDSFIRVWSSEGGCVKLLKGHTNAITSLSLVARSGSSTGEVVELVSSSKDRTLRLWQIQDPDSPTLETLRPMKCFKGHVSSVESVATCPSGARIGSGSWDSSIKLWPVLGEAEVDGEALKKQRLNDSGEFLKHGETQVIAESTLKGHTQCVSSVAFASDEYLYSVSWDHSIRGWNVETGANVETLTGTKALHCLSIGGEGSCLLATGGADNVLRIWDPRLVGVAVPVLQLTSHKAWITSCKWHPKSSHHLFSASHDGTVKLWDVRSKVPLYTVAAHTDKVWCADWWKDDSIVSGGADSRLNILHGIELSVS